MSIQTVIYAINFTTNTVIIFLDVLIFVVALYTGQIRKQIILFIIFLSIVMDIAVYLNTVVHDVPSFALDTDIFKTQGLAYISVIILCLQWFGQLFVLLMLSILHFFAVFSPTKFRMLLPKHMKIIDAIIVIIGVLLSIPMLTPFCGYIYLTQGHYWYFDMSKPYTYMYWTLNLFLQIVCTVVVLCVDSIIVWKICMSRTKSTKKKAATTTKASNVAVTSTVNCRKRISLELRLAINFLFLSACFLFMTVVYNVPYQQGIWFEFLMKFSSNLNLSKWAIYALGNPAIRRGVMGILLCRRIEAANISIMTVTPTR